MQTYGEVSEWSNVHAWKACVRKRTGGSNPLLSANKKTCHRAGFFYWLRQVDRRGFETALRNGSHLPF